MAVALQTHFGAAKSLLRTIRGTFDFTGRARRTELGWWCIAFMLANLILSALAADRLPPRQLFLAREALLVLFLLPVFALLVRRAHDHGRSGRWVLVLAALVAVHAYDAATDISFDHGAMVRTKLPWPLLVVALLLMFATFALAVAPETVGPNSYGPDPREG